MKALAQPNRHTFATALRLRVLLGQLDVQLDSSKVLICQMSLAGQVRAASGKLCWSSGTLLYSMIL